MFLFGSVILFILGFGFAVSFCSWSLFALHRLMSFSRTADSALFSFFLFSICIHDSVSLPFHFLFFFSYSYFFPLFHFLFSLAFCFAFCCLFLSFCVAVYFHAYIASNIYFSIISDYIHLNLGGKHQVTKSSVRRKGALENAGADGRINMYRIVLFPAQV